MKSTGLFGKNSGRVGGVVYSNYRGQQIVRSYQPQVKNPNSEGQVAQRAKFKLVSQLSASFGNELKSFSASGSASSRNAWVASMLKKTTFSSATKQASLPLEEIVLTNGHVGTLLLSDSGDRVVLFGFNPSVRVHEVVVAYKEGEELTVLASRDYSPIEGENGRTVVFEEIQYTGNFGNLRRIIFAYDYMDTDSYSTYQDYVVLNSDATLNAIQTKFDGKLVYSESLNTVVQLGV